MQYKIYNISAGEPFVDVLAERYLQLYENNPEGLAQVLFLLPNRRACQSLSDAFVRKRGMRPTILPQMKPIAEIDEDEIFLLQDSSVLSDLLPAVDPIDKVLKFTKMILKKSELGLDKSSLAQAYALAQNLCNLMDTVQNEGKDFNGLQNLVGEEFATHWQQTLELLQIITENWPKILKENGQQDLIEHRNKLLNKELDLWEETQTSQRIVVAGTTAAFPVLKRFVKTVLNLPAGEVYLYGLDKYLSDADWEQIDENHPQYELKELLQELGISRDSVTNIGSEIFTPRERVVAEIMRPAATSAAWRNLTADTQMAEEFKHIKLVNCDDMRQEAAAIALIIRDTLENTDKTAALVTTDRNLSRRVVSELQKWDINADDSAGKPLALTPIGIYLRLICKYMEERSDTAMIALMKHPFTRCGLSVGKFNGKKQHLEYCLRKDEPLMPALNEFVDDFKRRLQPLFDLYLQPEVDLAEIFGTHIAVAESLADTDLKRGGQIIWREDAGNVAAEWVADFKTRSEKFGSVKTNDYAPFCQSLLAELNVRKRYGTHPRVKILGPIEARLNQYGVTIIGGANEGTWPRIPEADMWMSRPMKIGFEIPLPERQIGVMAADFAHLLNAPEVYITRSKKVGKDPTDKSRWWLRIETVLEAVFGSEDDAFAFMYDQPYAYWAKDMDRRDKYNPIKPPTPCPDVNRRPRKMSASKFEKWMRNPYEIYAAYILKLYKLNELDTPKQAYDFGNIVHDVLKEFNRKHNDDKYPPRDEALKILMEMGQNEFIKREVPPEVSAFWLPKYKKQMEWVVTKELQCRAAIRKLHSEIEGECKIKTPTGDFTISGKADRIEELKDGTLNIVDYKTGNDSRKSKEIIDGKAPQLPIEAIIAQNRGYKEVTSNKVSGLQYWALKDDLPQETAANSKKIKKETCGEETQKAIEKMKEIVAGLIEDYANPKQAYLVKPLPSAMDDISNYDHLSRLYEWCVHSDETED